MEFYLTILNETVKLPAEKDSIGIIICKEKNRTVVEYALKTSTQPIGVAAYTITAHLPQQYQHLLPSGQEISDKINSFFQEH